MPSQSRSHAKGAVYWGDPTDENPVGCAEVTITPEDGDPPTVYYFSNDRLPTLDRGGPGTNKLNGNFVGINSPASPTTMDADANGVANTVDLPTVPADTIVIQNFYYSKDDYDIADLQAGDCE